MQEEVNSIRSLYVKSQSNASTSNTTFWWGLKGKQSESFLSQSEHTTWVSRHRTFITRYLHLEVFLWKQYIILASYKDFCKLQSFCLCTRLLLYLSNTYLLKLSSSQTFATRWSVSVVIAFPFLYEQVLLIFRLLFWFHVKFKQGIQRH